jgi:hypothetical protein
MGFKDQIQEATDSFVDAVLAAFREHAMTSTINGLLEDGDGDTAPAPAKAASTRAPRAAKAPKAAKSSKAPSGRLARRSLEEIDAVVSKVATLLKKHPNGLRSENIREELGLDVKEVPRVLKQGVANGAFKILSGEKRATTYGVKGGKGAKAAKTAKVAKKAPKAKKSAKKSAKRGAGKKAKKAAVASPAHTDAAAE